MSHTTTGAFLQGNLDLLNDQGLTTGGSLYTAGTIQVASTTDSTAVGVGSVITAGSVQFSGGLSVQKNLYCGGSIVCSGNITASGGLTVTGNTSLQGTVTGSNGIAISPLVYFLYIPTNGTTLTLSAGPTSGVYLLFIGSATDQGVYEIAVACKSNVAVTGLTPAPPMYSTNVLAYTGLKINIDWSGTYLNFNYITAKPNNGGNSHDSYTLKMFTWN
ncbi:uncharacterized protein BJ171DRAFT_607835 [Polychytrium aggregatum]|uniref:uncharacterized protein n=1 Tax=Polychytrium aggregatum TaxID=110093 RepID=UPI0022FF23D6|nr:uncharacterized protein BJ171DRAFT_607835 [Polychytrium aggregatum]KAI9188569.1 hypothetical protein BJ171DRAFT_607835 [Polychytrium aggregatum]